MQNSHFCRFHRKSNYLHLKVIYDISFFLNLEQVKIRTSRNKGLNKEYMDIEKCNQWKYKEQSILLNAAQISSVSGHCNRGSMRSLYFSKWDVYHVTAFHTIRKSRMKIDGTISPFGRVPIIKYNKTFFSRWKLSVTDRRYAFICYKLYFIDL